MIKKFLSYVEIMTKITSLFPFLMTIAFLVFSKQAINWKLTLIFFASMFLIDLTTTAINNYVDTKTNHQTLQFKRGVALTIIYVMLILSVGLGIYLAFLTDAVVLILGILSFMCGILYTYGPIPISRQPLGEIFSGLFQGFLIPFLLLYINMPQGTYVNLALSSGTIRLDMNIVPIVSAILLSVAPVCATANIMLANNICDLEKDIVVKRFTLPYYLGTKSLYLFASLYYLTYLATILMVILKILHPITLLSLLSIIIVHRNIKTFFKKQDKATTFVLSVKNYIIILGANTLMIFISALFV